MTPSAMVIGPPGQPDRQGTKAWTTSELEETYFEALRQFFTCLREEACLSPTHPVGQGAARIQVPEIHPRFSILQGGRLRIHTRSAAPGASSFVPSLLQALTSETTSDFKGGGKVWDSAPPRGDKCIFLSISVVEIKWFLATQAVLHLCFGHLSVSVYI